MPMRAAPMVTAISALAILAEPAEACSPFYQPFSEMVPSAPLAIRARPTFRFTARDYDISETRDGRLAGQVILEKIHCYRVARRIGRCPKRLVVDFDYALDGINCPPELNAIDPERLRYFLLWRGKAGAWQIDVARRRFDR
jgi:hypothetical protein